MREAGTQARTWTYGPIAASPEDAKLWTLAELHVRKASPLDLDLEP